MNYSGFRDLSKYIIDPFRYSTKWPVLQRELLCKAIDKNRRKNLWSDIDKKMDQVMHSKWGPAETKIRLYEIKIFVIY